MTVKLPESPDFDCTAKNWKLLPKKQQHTFSRAKTAT